ncbi:MAG: IclR family transcriptional regulator [Pseudomonadota bacterium]
MAAENGMAGGGTVGKALDVLDHIAMFARPVRFNELLTGSPYPKATLYRLVQVLVGEGMVTFNADQGTYSLGMRLVRLAHAAWDQSSLAPIARPHIDALSAQVGETVHLAQIDNAQVLYVDKRNARVPVEMYSQAGKVGPAYCTGVGKVMLAYLGPSELDRVLQQQAFHRFTPHTLTNEDQLRRELSDIRANGYGFDREEHEPGIICVAVPILSAQGRLLGALSVTSTTSRTNLAALEAQLPQIQTTVSAIAEEVQAWRFPDQAPASMED